MSPVGYVTPYVLHCGCVVVVVDDDKK